MQTQFFEIYRAGLKSAADMMTASLETARQLQQQQLDTLQLAIEEQARSVRELADASSMDELMTLQTRLAGSQLQRTMDLWSRLWRAAGDNQLAFMGQAQAHLGPLAHLREAAIDLEQPLPQQRAA